MAEYCQHSVKDQRLLDWEQGCQHVLALWLSGVGFPTAFERIYYL
jgi:hypothetical protein